MPPRRKPPTRVTAQKHPLNGSQRKCLKYFSKKKPNQRFCSESCKQAYHRDRILGRDRWLVERRIKQKVDQRFAELLKTTLDFVKTNLEALRLRIEALESRQA